jgi:hypothetical protein
MVLDRSGYNTCAPMSEKMAILKEWLKLLEIFEKAYELDEKEVVQFKSDLNALKIRIEGYRAKHLDKNR